MIGPRDISQKIVRSLRYWPRYYRDYLRASFAAFRFHAKLKMKRALGRRPLILVVRPGAIGDIVCTFPLLDALRQKHPKAYLVYGSLRVLTPVAAMSASADAVVEIDGDCRAPKIREADYDLVVRPTYGSDEPDGQDRCHMVDDYCGRAGLTPPERQPRIFVNSRLRESMCRQISRIRGGAPSRPLVAIHTGPSWAVRTWPQERWEALVGELKRTLGATVIQLGSDFHLEASGVKEGRVHGAVDWLGRHTIAETAAVLQLCDFFIGIDSGLLHIAGAVGTPCVGLFGATSAEYRMPPQTPSIAVQGLVACAGCHHEHPRLHWKTGCPHDIACMQSIGVARVLDACTTLLDGARAPVAS